MHAKKLHSEIYRGCELAEREAIGFGRWFNVIHIRRPALPNQLVASVDTLTEAREAVHDAERRKLI